MSPLLHYSQLGQGEPLVILHGLFGSGKNWQSLARQFAEKYRVYLVDLRNHGDSFHDPQMNYEVMAEDISRLISHLGIGQCSMLGHSMGGKVAMLYALRNPDRVSKLIVADIAPVTYEHSHSQLIEPILAVDLGRLTGRAEADKTLAGEISEPMLRGFLLQNLVRQGGGWRWKVNWCAIQQQMHSLVDFPIESGDRSGVSTLFIRGQNSDYIDQRGLTAIRQIFINAQIVTIDHAGHWLHAEQPKEFAKLVLGFL